MIRKPAETHQPIHELLAQRWSGRAFQPDRVFTPEEIGALMEAARWAPSCFNDQPWRYIVWDRFRDTNTWQQAFHCLNEANRAWVQDASLLLVACADSEFATRPGTANRFGQYDTGAASMAICLQASAMELMAHQMAGFDSERLRTTFAIPDRYAVMAMIAIGAPVESQTDIREIIRDRELASRARNALGEHFFSGKWGQGMR